MTPPWSLLAIDWNGTTLDDTEVNYLAVAAIFEHFGLVPPSRKTYCNEIGSQFVDFYRKYGIPPEISPEELDNIRTQFLLKHPIQANLHTGAEDLIHNARSIGIKLVIVSGEDPIKFEKDFARVGLDKRLFDAIYIGVRNKTEALLAVAQYLEKAPKETVYLDDTHSGCVAARNAGCSVIGATYGWAEEDRILEANPDFRASSITEAWSIVKINALWRLG